jgi:hypothetical protein
MGFVRVPERRLPEAPEDDDENQNAGKDRRKPG